MHVLILGRTGSGKTLLCRHLIRDYRQAGLESLVLDPLGDPRYVGLARFVTRDPGAFMRAARLSLSCMLFIDESGEAIGQHNAEMFWLATRARHLGHASHFVAQRAAQIAPTVRDQCEALVCFAVSREDAKTLAREWSSDQLLEAPQLPRFHYLVVRPFGGTTRGQVALDVPEAPLHVDASTPTPPGDEV